MSCKYCIHFDEDTCKDSTGCFEPCRPEDMPAAPDRTFKSKRNFKQEALHFAIARDYSRIHKELPEQLPITDLPLFDTESQNVEQVNLFA